MADRGPEFNAQYGVVAGKEREKERPGERETDTQREEVYFWLMPLEVLVHGKLHLLLWPLKQHANEHACGRAQPFASWPGSRAGQKPGPTNSLQDHDPKGLPYSQKAPPFKVLPPPKSTMLGTNPHESLGDPRGQIIALYNKVSTCQGGVLCSEGQRGHGQEELSSNSA